MSYLKLSRCYPKGYKGPRIQGSSEMLKNFKDVEERYRRNRKNVKCADKVFRKQTLESLTS